MLVFVNVSNQTTNASSDGESQIVIVSNHSFVCLSISLPQNIMRDKWMNIGYEDDDLKPYVEPPADVLDPMRIGKDNVPPVYVVFVLSTLVMQPELVYWHCVIPTYCL